MNAYELKELVSDGEPFGVVFTKKDKSDRVMIAKTGVTEHLRGGFRAYEAEKRNLLFVFDVEAEEYRTINCDTIKVLIVGGNRII